MSRLERLREYARPSRPENWQGAGRDQANIDRWSERASENSQVAPRAAKGEVRVPDTGKRTELRDTAMSPRTSRKVDAAMRGADEDDLNHVGSPFMRDVRRTT
jgi:hypothetical protein